MATGRNAAGFIDVKVIEEVSRDRVFVSAPGHQNVVVFILNGPVQIHGKVSECEVKVPNILGFHIECELGDIVVRELVGYAIQQGNFNLQIVCSELGREFGKRNFDASRCRNSVCIDHCERVVVVQGGLNFKSHDILASIVGDNQASLNRSETCGASDPCEAGNCEILFCDRNGTQAGQQR